MRVLVTGANGFVGAALCRALLARGDDVAGIVRASSDLSLLQGVPLPLHTASLNDLPRLEKLCTGMDVIHHVAALASDWGDDALFHQANVLPTQNLLEAASRCHVPHFVYISSVAVHNFINAKNMDENSPQLPTPFGYARSKRQAEALVQAYHQQGKINATIIRPGDCYGPGDRTTLLKLGGLLKQGAMPLVAGGEKYGAFTYIDNLIQGIILAGTSHRPTCEAYIITDGVAMTWRSYFQKLTAALGYPPPRASIPGWLVRSSAWLLEAVYHCWGGKQRPPLTRYLAQHLTNDHHFSVEKARQQLGYCPDDAIDAHLQKTAEWYLQYAEKST